MVPGPCLIRGRITGQEWGGGCVAVWAAQRRASAFNFLLLRLLLGEALGQEPVGRGRRGTPFRSN